MFGKQMPVEPHRFLSLECVKINVNTTGYADKIIIRFSPELEAMRFTDPYGKTYDYVEDFAGMEDYVYFPQDSTFMLNNAERDSRTYWEYTLPLANSTKDWNDNYIRQPYWMEVTAYKGEQSVLYLIDDIEITGNIYDLIYEQPLDN